MRAPPRSVVLIASALVVSSFAVLAYRQRPGRLVVRTACALCEVRIDGEIFAPGRREFPVAPYVAHEVALSGPCDELATRSVTARPLEKVEVALDVPLLADSYPLRALSPRGHALPGARFTAGPHQLPVTGGMVQVPRCAPWIEVSGDGRASLRVQREDLAGAHDLTLPDHGTMVRVASPGLDAFEIDERPVTRDQYAQCLAVGACIGPREDWVASQAECTSRGGDYADCVTALEARAYCAYRGKRLPTSDEWARLHDEQPELTRAPAELTEASAPPAARWRVRGTPDAFRTPSVMPNGNNATATSRTDAAFRCARSAVAVRRHPGPCSKRVELAPFDWQADRRVVYRYGAQGALTKATRYAMHRDLGTSDVTSEGLPSHALGGGIANARGDLVVALGSARAEREHITYDEAGNITSTLALLREPAGTWLLEEFAYGCWQDDAASCPGSPDVAVDLGLDGCVRGKAGTWSLRFDALSTWLGNEGSEGVQGDFRFAYTPEGKGTKTAIGEARSFTLHDITIHAIEVVAHHDIDGDRHEELFVRSRAGAVEDAGESYDILTYRNGAVGAYPVADLGQLLEVRDVDRDGRPDLLSTGTLQTPDDHVMGCACGGGFPTLSHALADGTFSREDAVVKRYLRDKCRTQPTAQLFTHEEGDAMAALDCLHLRGATLPELKARIRDDWATRACAATYCCCEQADFERHAERLAAAQPALLAR